MAAAVSVAWLTAVAAGPSPGDLAVYGPLGVLAVAALAGAIMVYRDQRTQIIAAQDRADRISAEKDALAKDVMEKVIPVLTQAVTVMGLATELQRRGSR